MDFALDDEQRALRAAARRYLADRYPSARVAELADAAGGSQAEAWPELTRQGWLDADLGSLELGLLAEESGAALHPAPWWTSVALALPVYSAAGEGLPGPATLAVRDEGEACRAFVVDGGWLLRGTKWLVPDAGPAVEILVLALTPEGEALFAVPPGAEVTVTEATSLDLLRPMSRVVLADAPARLLTTEVSEVLGAVRRRASALLACEAVGVAARALDMAVEYAKLREQFGRPIGSYQAVAHQLADGYLEVELARSLAWRAAWLESDDEALACAVVAGRHAAIRCCELAIQVTGGIAVTWEYPLHHWYRRALWLEAFDGVGGDQHDVLAAHLLGK